jgi:hypothetical protein
MNTSLVKDSMVFSNSAATGAIARTFKQIRPERPRIIKTRRLSVWSGGMAANKVLGREDFMWDLLMVGITIGFFIVALLYVNGCEKLR